MVMTAAVMTVAALAGVAGWWLHAPVDASARPVRFTFAFGPMRQFAAPTLTIAISPDGGRIAYPSDGRLYIRRVNQFRGTPVANSEGGDTPFFSRTGNGSGSMRGAHCSVFRSQAGRRSQSRMSLRSSVQHGGRMTRSSSEAVWAQGWNACQPRAASLVH
jgi:hypothetical protein